MRKLLAMAAALVLVLAMGTAALADDEDGTFIVEGIRYRILGDSTVSVISDTDLVDEFAPPANLIGRGDSTYSGEITIPETVTNNGITYTVTIIETQAFKEANNKKNRITKVTLPKTIKEIHGFEGCTELTEVTFSDKSSLETIASRTFFGCTQLSNFEIPSTVTTIGPEAFANCSSLKSIHIPAGVTEGLENVVAGYPNTVTIDEGNPYDIEGDILYKEGVAYYHFGMEERAEIVIREGTTEIAPGIFNGDSGLTKISLPESLTTIGEGAFKGCESLKEIVIPEGVTEIPDSAFKGCVALEYIILPEGLESIGAQAFNLTNNRQNQNNNPRLNYINIPASVNSVGKWFLAGIKANGETTVVFQSDDVPIFEQFALSLISGNYNKPTVYYPAGAEEAYAGEGSALVAAGLVAAPGSDENTEQGYALPASGNVSIAKGSNIELGKYTLPDGTRLDITSGDIGIATVSDENGKLMVTGVSSGTTTITIKIMKSEIEIVKETYAVTVTGSSPPVPTPDPKPVYRDTVTIEVGGEKTESGNKNEENPNTGAPAFMGIFLGAMAATK